MNICLFEDIMELPDLYDHYNYLTPAMESAGEVTQPKTSSPPIQAPAVKNASANTGAGTRTPNSATRPGPRRLACKACRNRRIRCKHKDTSALDQDEPASPPAPIAVKILRLRDTTRAASASSQKIALQQPSGPRVKACNKCRKIKVRTPLRIPLQSAPSCTAQLPTSSYLQRRCMHDEFGNGNTDPVKLKASARNNRS